MIASLRYCPTPIQSGVGLQAGLTKCGSEIASEERVPVTLEATINAEPLCRRIGFRDYSYKCLVEDVDGSALIWEPEELKGSYSMNFPARETLIE